jgi:hypothetical protein
LLTYKGYAVEEYHWTFSIENKLSSPIQAHLFVRHQKGRSENQAAITIDPGQKKELTSTDSSKSYAQYAAVIVNGITCMDTYNITGAAHIGKFKVEVAPSKKPQLGKAKAPSLACTYTPA